MDNVKLGQDQYTLLDLHSFVREAQEVASIWRPESWAAEEFRDGVQYIDAEASALFNAGIDPLTVNRVFPIINLLLGLQIVNKYETGAKGRTQNDAEIGQLMSEGIAFIDDQNRTEFLVGKAYKDQIVPGIGWLMVGHSDDPREEIVRVAYRDWKEMWWDPMGDPWLDVRECRYVFNQRWKDIEDLIAFYPWKADELNRYSFQSDGGRANSAVNIWYDEAQQVEDLKLMYGGRVQRHRRRVRPVEMWYPVFRTSMWAKYKDGTSKEIPVNAPKMEQYKIIQGADKVIKATVRRMWNTTFLDDIVLYDGPTPYNHDLYPFVPFIGYLDRFGFPFGVPHQMKGQQKEVNKRRSMALALLQKRRVITTTDVVPDGPNAQKDLIRLHEEANKLDGFMVIAAGKQDQFKIIEGTDKGMLQAQVMMLQQSERELKEISGANDEQAGIKGQAISGIAIEKRQEQSSVVLTPLAENLRRSKHMLGTLQVAEIQGQWTAEKILRVTDRITGAEKYVTLNERVYDEQQRAYVVRNNVTQGKFDIIVTDAPPSDAVREQNMNLLIEWAKKSPPEMIPHIMLMAMDLSNLPNKDMLLDKLKEVVGVNPLEGDMSADERKQKVLETLQRHQEQAQAEAEFQQQLKCLSLEKAQLENDLLRAQIKQAQSQPGIDLRKVKVADDKVKIDGFKVGAEVAAERKRHEADQLNRYADAVSREEKGAVA